MCRRDISAQRLAGGGLEHRGQLACRQAAGCRQRGQRQGRRLGVAFNQVFQTRELPRVEPAAGRGLGSAATGEMPVQLERQHRQDAARLQCAAERGRGGFLGQPLHAGAQAVVVHVDRAGRVDVVPAPVDATEQTQALGLHQADHGMPVARIPAYGAFRTGWHEIQDARGALLAVGGLHDIARPPGCPGVRRLGQLDQAIAARQQVDFSRVGPVDVLHGHLVGRLLQPRTEHLVRRQGLHQGPEFCGLHQRLSLASIARRRQRAAPPRWHY